MIRVNIICEGPTEATFVSRILASHLLMHNVVATPHSLGTGTNYPKLKREVLRWMKAEPGAWLTTMIDLYAMPDEFPGFEEHRNKQPASKIVGLEAAFKEDIEAEGLDTRRFIPYYQLHEFEALLFSAPEVMEEWLGIDYQLPAGVFQAIRGQYPTPEDINNSRHTAPSKRILQYIPGYRKPTNGYIVASEIGLERIRRECPHFNQWLERLESIGLPA